MHNSLIFNAIYRANSLFGILVVQNGVDKSSSPPGAWVTIFLIDCYKLNIDNDGKKSYCYKEKGRCFMKKMLEQFKEYFKAHKIIAPLLIISFVLNILIFCFYSYLCFLTKQVTWLNLLILVPSLLFALVAFLLNKFKKIDWKYRIVSIISVGFLLFLHMIIFLLILLSLVFISPTDYWNRPSAYPEVIKWGKEEGYLTKFFPPEIPKEAKKVKMISGTNPPFSVFAYIRVAVSFEITPEYIENIKKEYKHIKPILNAEQLPDYDTSRPMPLSLMDKKSKLYIIVSKDEYPDENHENTYWGGIVINEDTNKVIYFYQTLYGDHCPKCYAGGKKSKTMIELVDYQIPNDF